MVFRIFLILTLAIELGILLGFACIFSMGGLPENPVVGLWLLGAVVMVAVTTAVGLPASAASRVATHGALIAGAFVFSLPFLWLVGTSFKYPEETFESPPRWIPQVPQQISRSPYVDQTALDTPCPKAYEPAVWQAALPLLPQDDLALVEENQVRRAVTGLIWEIVDATHDDPSRDDVLEAVNAGNVGLAWERVFRAVEIGAITLYNHERVASPIGLTQARWEAEGASVIPATNTTRLQYDWSAPRDDTFRVTLQLPLPIPAEELFQVSLGMRQDRSWHRLRAELTVDGRRYASTDPMYLGDDGFREIGFKIGGEDQRDIGVFDLTEVGRAEAAGHSTDYAELTLSVDRRSRVGAAWAKYTQAYRDAWHADRNWPRYLVNTVIIVGLSVLGQILSCSMVAYAFARIRWPGREPLFLVLLATMMLPGQVTMIPVFLIFKSIGWYNTLLPLWVPAFLASPFFVFLLRQFMKSIPREIEEAALIDGCSWYGIYWRIVLPLMKPGLAAIAIFTFMGVWNEFMAPLIYLSDSRLYPLAMGLYNFRSEHGGEFGMLMAASTIMIVPAIVLFFAAQRYFIEGVTLTGIKG